MHAVRRVRESMVSLGRPDTDTATWPPNHGLISFDQSCLPSLALSTSRSSVSSSFVSSVDWSAKPGKWARNRPRFWRWSPGRSPRTST